MNAARTHASAVAIALAFASSAAAAADAVSPADLVIVNADVRTADPDRPRAGALAVRDGRFVALGSREDIEPRTGADTRVIDAEGATVLPGFVDGHTHLASGGSLIVGVDLFGLPDKSGWLSRVAEKVDRALEGDWVLGGRWDHTLTESGYPTRWDLDAVSKNNPVALTDIDSHSLWVNSQALELAGITARTPVPPGGEIVIDEETGEPTGILKEGAMALLESADGYTEAVNASRDALPATLRYANSLGITSVHDMSGAGALESYRDLAAAGELTARVWFGYTGIEEPGQVPAIARVRQQYAFEAPERGPMLALGYLKLMIDGVLSTHTAAMLEPYSDRPGVMGEPFLEPDNLNALVDAGNAAGFPVAIHAIGDRGVRLALDAFEASGHRELANRIEHIEILHPDDVARFAKLNVAASMQPNHCTGVIGKYITERVGPARERQAYVWGHLLRAGAHLALSSDWPTAPLSPLEQLADAMLRESPTGLFEGTWYPGQALGFEQALFAYTQGNAELTPWGASTGSISVGKWADFVLLDDRLADGSRQAIGRDLQRRRVMGTYLAGRPVYDAATEPASREPATP